MLFKSCNIARFYILMDMKYWHVKGLIAYIFTWTSCRPHRHRQVLVGPARREHQRSQRQRRHHLALHDKGGKRQHLGRKFRRTNWRIGDCFYVFLMYLHVKYFLFFIIAYSLISSSVSYIRILFGWIFQTYGSLSYLRLMLLCIVILNFFSMTYLTNLLI